MLQDRQGSVMARAGDSTALERHDYFPYGEERTPSIGDRNKFGTYHRDQTGLDYADQRYYNSAIGRFLSADPYEGSAAPSNPRSWGRGAYVEGDPVNANDPNGLTADFETTAFGHRYPDFCWVMPEHHECAGYPFPMNMTSFGFPPGNAVNILAFKLPPPPEPDCLPTALPSEYGSLVSEGQWDDLSRDERVAFLNFTAVAAAVNMPLDGWVLMAVVRDRMFLATASTANNSPVQGLTLWLTSSPNFTSTSVDPLVGPVHSGMEANFRQNVPWYAMQVNTNSRSGIVEIDIDYANPAWGVLPLIGHSLEVSFNRLLGRTTDPYRVADALRIRGISVGHDCGRARR
jgi:RHS repeat-associated protein